MPNDIQANPAMPRSAPLLAQTLSEFDFNAAAELFPSRIKNGRQAARYQRFDTAAEAVRFAVEEIPASALLGVYLEVDEVRFGRAEIHQLYESAGFPLERGGTRKD
jgi:hypothetical protein